MAELYAKGKPSRSGLRGHDHGTEWQSCRISMSASDKHIMIVGAASSVGKVLAEQLQGRRTILASRQLVAVAAPHRALVKSYESLTPADFEDVDTVINCVGVSRGSTALMDRVTTALPVHIAEVARDAGAAKFVQLSSFSVYGAASFVKPCSLERPVSNYGRAKLSADQQILNLADSSFAPVCVRLPMLFQPGDGGKLTRLITMLASVPVFAVPRHEIGRSVMSVPDAAFTLVQIADSQYSGVVHAADPIPMTYRLVTEAMRRAAVRPPTLVKFPVAITSLCRHNSVLRSLYCPSLLDGQINVARDFALPLGLIAGLDQMIARR